MVEKKKKANIKRVTKKNDASKSSDAETGYDSEMEKKPFNKSLIFGLIGLFFAIVIIFVAVFAFRKIPDYNNPKASPLYTNAFFVYDNGKYTLWNSDGKRLTDDEYDDKSAFVGGYAYVRKGGEYALINDMGRTTVDFGHISITNNYGAGLYVAIDNNGTRHLMLGSGRILLSDEDIQLDLPSASSTFAVALCDGYYYVYNYAGVLMAQLEMVDDAVMRYSSSDDFGLVFYNNWNLVFDNRAGKQIAMFEGDRYSIDSVSDDRSVVLLEEYDNSKDYKVISRGDLYDLNETSNYGFVRDTDVVIGYDSYDAVSLLDKNYKVEKTVSSGLAFKDNNNYAMVNDDDRVEIRYHGDTVRIFDEKSELVSGVVLYDDLYAVKSGEKYSFYHLDGSFAFGDYQDISSLFDKHHHAIVSDDGESYYMIGSTGNRVNDFSFKRAYSYNKSYVVYDENDMRAILTENGFPVTGFDYEEAYNRSVAVDHEIWSLKRDTNNYDVIDVTASKEKRFLVSGVDIYNFYANYFTVKNSNGGYDYYTYKGVLFFTANDK